MGIRASYWATGGILTVLGLIVGQAILGVLASVAATVGAFLVGALAFALKATLIVGAVLAAIGLGSLLARMVRRRRRLDP